MRRGDLVTVALPGDLGKPRPALIVQSDQFASTRSVTVLPLTSALSDAPLLRLTVEPTSENGLRVASQIMIDKLTTVRRDRIGSVFGMLDSEGLRATQQKLAFFLGFV